jgi:predicted RNA binding protein YcfA (HicA-like mRNA interferase family)
VTAKEFKQKLKAADRRWKFGQGTKHEYATHPDKPGVRIQISRGTGEIPTGTLDKMLKDAGLK